jgi:hypothetical protein
MRTERNGSLSHAGMNRIRSQGLLSARRTADTPSDTGNSMNRTTKGKRLSRNWPCSEIAVFPIFNDFFPWRQPRRFFRIFS